MPSRTTINGMTTVEIPCCICGTMIQSNAVNQCSSCLAQQVDLRGLLQRGPGGSSDIIIHQCRQCRRFERNDGGRKYVSVDLESPELMAILLKHIPALASNSSGPKMQLKDAMFVWTEPNSMRIKVRLTVRTQVLDAAVTIQQRCVVEFHIKFHQCGDCNREYTNRTWQALVQLRQRRGNDEDRKGLAVLEMALARNATIRQHVLSMDTSKQGFDFYFVSLTNAQYFAAYLAKVAPMRIQTTKKLISTDVKSNISNLKHTVSCDMVPLCRDDLVLIHKRHTSASHLSGRLALVTKMSSVVQFVDASPTRTPVLSTSFGEMSPEAYYKAGGDKMVQVLSSSRRLQRFIVLDLELCHDDTTKQYHHSNNNDRPLYQGPSSTIDKYALADVVVARESDFGRNDETYTCVTHLGNLLQAGDTVLGYDLVSSVLSGAVVDDMDSCFNHQFTMPDIVLVKKVKGVEKDNNSINEEESEDHKALEKTTSGRAKKREKRRKREEKKTRALEEAASRMGFMDTNHQSTFEQELENDPDLADELRTAERELVEAQQQQQQQQTKDRDTVPAAANGEAADDHQEESGEDQLAVDKEGEAGKEEGGTPPSIADQ